jgi:hypothetical protein
VADHVFDSFTAEVRLCDDEGIVSHKPVDPPNPLQPDLTYLQQHDRLVKQTPNVQARPIGPFGCTGHAHLAGHHIRCTSRAHKPIRFGDVVGGVADDSVGEASATSVLVIVLNEPHEIQALPSLTVGELVADLRRAGWVDALRQVHVTDHNSRALLGRERVVDVVGRACSEGMPGTLFVHYAMGWGG